MKRIIVLITIMVIINFACIFAPNSYASDYAGDEKEDSIFQKLSDLISGKYEVEGKPLNKKGIFQVLADETQKIKPESETAQAASK